MGRPILSRKAAPAMRHGKTRHGKRHGKYGLRSVMEKRHGESVMESVTQAASRKYVMESAMEFYTCYSVQHRHVCDSFTYRLTYN